LKKTKDVDGSIIECGIFKGTSFVNICAVREIFEIEHKKAIGFDFFDDFEYSEDDHDEDLTEYRSFISQAGKSGISAEDLKDIMKMKGFDNYELVKGDISKTMESYSKGIDCISFINIDVDLYRPTKKSIEYLYPKLSVGGIMLLDDYDIFPGATRAVHEYFGNNPPIRRFSFRDSPVYIIKE
jgi:hypothetical protein